MMVINTNKHIRDFFFKEGHIAPLAFFRIVFGLMMLGGTIRFAAKGWIYDQYIKPGYYFSYYGFDWIKPLGETGMYMLFAVMGIAALCMAIGLLYRYSTAVFFLVFSYIELIDKSNYLNHYYFVSIVSFLMIWLPAGRYFSIDVWLKPERKISHAPVIFIRIVQLQLALVYFFAGVAKLNYDWLVEAQPLRIWLQPHTNLPVIGYFMDKTWVAYFFSWFGAIYDLSIPFLLFNKKTRSWAYIAVIVFHILTAILFPIGLFPYIMILCTLIFFSERFHQNCLRVLGNIFKIRNGVEDKKLQVHFSRMRIFCMVMVLHFVVQIAIPFRYALYPGKLFWTEQGYRFSWRVMLMEKAGKTFFYVSDPKTGKSSEVLPAEYLTCNQEKMMSTQPDMILQFAQFISAEYQKKGIAHPDVRVQSYVTLNGSGSRPFINPNTNLAIEHESFLAKNWILPFDKH